MDEPVSVRKRLVTRVSSSGIVITLGIALSIVVFMSGRVVRLSGADGAAALRQADEFASFFPGIVVTPVLLYWVLMSARFDRQPWRQRLLQLGLLIASATALFAGGMYLYLWNQYPDTAGFEARFTSSGVLFAMTLFFGTKLDVDLFDVRDILLPRRR